MKSINNVPFINGFEYGWSDVKVLINNTPMIGIVSINYTETESFENLYGIGNQPIARGTTNFECTADLTVYKSELIALQAAARAAGVVDGSIQGILPFDIIVSYSKPDGSGITTDILKNCQFTNNGVGVASGASNIQTTLTLILSHIQWGVTA